MIIRVGWRVVIAREAVTSSLDYLEFVLCAPASQYFLIELSDAGLGNFFDEAPSLGYPPFRDALRQKSLQVSGRRG